MSSFMSTGEQAETNGVSHHTSWLMSVYNLYSNQPTFLCRAAVVIKAARWLFLLLQHFTNTTEVPYFSPDEHTHTHTHTHTEIHTPPLSLAWHVGAVPVLCPLRRERFWTEPGWNRETCRLRLTQSGLQNVLARFISLLTSLSTRALTWIGKFCLAVYLTLHTNWCVCAVCQHAVPLYSYLVNWRNEANARGLIMSC